MAEDRKKNKLQGIEPDSKSQVTMEYENDKPVKVTSVVISTQHSKDLNQDQVKELVYPYIQKAIPNDLINNLSQKNVYINPTGQFIIGGPDGDTGLTGRKIIVDTYGGAAPHGGGAFSGKDPSKVDRSATYMARYIAKNIVAADLAQHCEVQLSYGIGVAEPTSFYVKTNGTSKKDDETLTKIAREVFPLRPGEIVAHLDLKKPRYRKTAAYGHFGRELEEFTWEKTDMIDKLISKL